MSILGVVLGLAGMLTIVPALFDSLIMVFGPGMVVWSIWLGIVLLRRKAIPAARQAEIVAPHGAVSFLSH